MDPLIQEERHDVQTVDLTHTYQSEESESIMLETPSIDQVGETYFQDQSTVLRMYPLLVRRAIARVWTHLYGIQAQMIIAG
jgi:hypothetical protein